MLIVLLRLSWLLFHVFLQKLIQRFLMKFLVDKVMRFVLRCISIITLILHVVYLIILSWAFIRALRHMKRLVIYHLRIIVVHLLSSLKILRITILNHSIFIFSLLLHRELPIYKLLNMIVSIF